jgi:hypothetical protein
MTCTKIHDSVIVATTSKKAVRRTCRCVGSELGDDGDEADHGGADREDEQREAAVVLLRRSASRESDVEACDEHGRLDEENGYEDVPGDEVPRREVHCQHSGSIVNAGCRPRATRRGARGCGRCGAASVARRSRRATWCRRMRGAGHDAAAAAPCSGTSG